MAERRSRIPGFTTYEEEAAFWDNHSLAEFADELKVAKDVKVARPLVHHLSVRLDAKTLVELAALATRLGVGPSTLARMWIMQRLAQEREAGTTREQRSPRTSPASSKVKEG
ncbi:MAG: hypothetical protein HY690_10350 [Chloroflexi bacterium]|nr:hypothetical protein [Chloroflexota bacterium]